MSQRPARDGESMRRGIYALADALLSGAITAEEAQQLEELVCNDAEACGHYVRFMHDSAALYEWGAADEEPPADTASPLADRPPGVHLSCLSRHCSLSFFGAATLSYLIAGVIVGGAILAAGVWGLPHDPLRIAETTPAAAPVIPAATMTCVGQVTAARNVKWADPKTAMADMARGKIALAAGLMELAYYDGARVILQGPAEYIVDSPHSGAMNFGKVTVRCEGKREGEATFSIRTPAIIVTERGGEFGLSVEKSKTCLAYAFHGDVQWRYIAPDGPQQWEPLQKGRYVWIAPGADEFLTATYFWPTPAKPAPMFARQLPKGASVVFTGKDKSGAPGT